MSSMNELLTIEYQPASRRGLTIVKLKLDEKVVYVDTIDIHKACDRQKFVRDATGRLKDVSVEKIDDLLLSVVAEYVSDSGVPSPGKSQSDELCIQDMVRSERFIRRQVNALSVPTRYAEGNQVVTRMSLYLRWETGQRERRDLLPRLDLPDGTTLYIQPLPSELSFASAGGWSQQGRLAWMAGQAAPNPGILFQSLTDKLAYYLDLPDEATIATLALWIIFTYIYPAWHSLPYLFITGPLGSGKSRVFELLQQLVFRPLASSNMTAACLFRTLDAEGGTLLLDEAERLRSDTPDTMELRSILLAGYKKGGNARRLEMFGEGKYKSVVFDVFGPKAIACISGLPSAVASRCIVIRMFRAPSNSLKTRRRVDADVQWQSLRDDLHALALEHGTTWLQLAEYSQCCPESLSNRDYELWQPLLALASWLEQYGAAELLTTLTSHAQSVTQNEREEQVPDADETFLRILAEYIFNGDVPKAGDILAQAQEKEPRSFQNWTPRGVAECLKRYGLRTTKYLGEKRYCHITDRDLLRIQSRYNMDLGLSSSPEQVVGASVEKSV